MQSEIKRRPTAYLVDGTTQRTSKDELTVERVLEKAGVRVEPEAEAGALLWEVRAAGPVPHPNLAEKIPINGGEQFVTLSAALAAIDRRFSPDQN